MFAELEPNTTLYTDHSSYSGPHSYYVQAYNADGEGNSNQVLDQGHVY